jgi:hypothetical protein
VRGAPDCPVPHAGLFGAPGTVALTTSSRWHCGEKTTGLSGVESLQHQRSPVVAGQWLGAPDTQQCAVRCSTRLFGAPPDCPVCRREQQLFSNGYNCVGAINTPPTGHFKVWEPKQHTKCDGTSQVIRPTYSCPCPTDLRQPCRCP